MDEFWDLFYSANGSGQMTQASPMAQFQGQRQGPAISSQQLQAAQTPGYAQATQAGQEQDRRDKIAGILKGVGSGLDHLGSAFDQRLSDVVIPNRQSFVWAPQINPGVAGLIQQLLAGGRAGY